ncbi:alpha/beta hydrolase [Nocardioides lentus]|uniref:alpha/beta hydrolase n=1 Tax=Nocardioides lentus TaxID=338077 RepID=UPI0031CE0EB6
MSETTPSVRPAPGRDDLLPGFETHDVDVTHDRGGTTLRVAVGGSGPPLLLQHGHPQNHLTWHLVAPRLAEDFTVVLPDLRGYGDSGKPAPTGEAEPHAAYTKRTMAADLVALMATLGHDRFAMVGHDRGGRVGHRLALDHPDVLTRLAVIDIAPTLTMYERTDQAFATGYYHWFFLVQPAPVPERMILASPGAFLLPHLASQVVEPAAQDPRLLEDYLRCYADPAMVHAICEDYRAAATTDLDHDRADADTGIGVPLMALWGAHGLVGSTYDVLATWQEKVAPGVEVAGQALDGRHSLQEECPDQLLAALGPFLAGG